MNNYKLTKYIANISFCAAPLIYAGMFVVIALAKEQLGFWGVLGVFMYGSLTVLGLIAISLVARSILLYQHSEARTWQQKLLLALTALPLLGFLGKLLIEKLST